jgi:tetratricopeptide (TPR) repeat protein
MGRLRIIFCLYLPLIIFGIASCGEFYQAWGGLFPRDESEAALKSARLYARGDLKGAVQVLKDAIKIEPEDAQLHFMLGNALFRQKEYNSAIKYYGEAAQLRENHPDTHLNLGFAYFHANVVDDAVLAWRVALSQTPNDAFMHLSLAVGLYAQGKVEEARKHVSHAIALDPNWENRILIDIRWNQGMVLNVGRLSEKIREKE